MRTKWEMSCPLPEALPEQGSTAFGFQVRDDMQIQIFGLETRPKTVLSACFSSDFVFQILQISISNNGVLFSDPADLTVYDSICRSCISANNCSRLVSASAAKRMVTSL